MSAMRLRYAGAPSGDLHIGNVRTALFNWLLARHEGGSFIIRIEDTDPEKSKPEFIERFFETLSWLGLDWDEGPDVGGPHEPYRQSEREPFHREMLDKLVSTGAVYRCYCTREDVVARGTKTGYDRYCRTHPRQEGKPFALRFAVPEQDTVVRDLLRGDVVTAFDQMQDFVVARSDGSPTFVLANTADDIAMEITHVLRATDLLPAAAQNTLLFKAIGVEPPKYAHVPLVLGQDKSRLGARHGAVGTLAYRDAGYLPEALMNYLALVGWSPGTDEEIFNKAQLVERFTLDGIQDSPGVFDVAKLDWMNQQYVQKLPNDEFERRVLEFTPDLPVDTLRKVLELDLIQTRVTKLTEVPDAIRYLHERPHVEPIADQPVLAEVANRLESLEPWAPEAIKEVVQSAIADLGLHRRKGPKPIFVAISGSDRALPLFESIYLIGRDEAVERLRVANGSP